MCIRDSNILEYAELMLFLLAAMTYINAMEERLVFESLRSWLVRKGFTYRQLFWLTGILAFFISPVADNLTTALLMCAVVFGRSGQSPVRQPGVYQYRGGGQRRRGLQSLRRHHDVDGMAKRNRGLLHIFSPVRALGG